MARLRDRLIAHGELADHLLPSFQLEGLSLTMLFAGPSGIGKRFTALSLAQGLLCERSTAACGQCGSCLRVEQGNHEGLKIISPEGTQIKIDQAREVIEFLSLQRISRSRVVIIDQAQSLNPQASNALLKVLEEPPEGTFIFLIAPSPSSVLPTLRSRSRSVLFRPLSLDELRRVQVAPDWALRASRGSVEAVRALMEPEQQEVRKETAQILESFLNQEDFLLHSDWRTSLKEKGFFPLMLRHWQGFVRDALILRAQGESLLMNPDLKALLATLAEQDLEKLEGLAERLLRVEADTAFHRDAQLVMEDLWVFWWRGGQSEMAATQAL